MKRGLLWNVFAGLILVMVLISNGYGASAKTILDEVSPGSLDGWTRSDNINASNPVLTYSEVTEGYEGSLAIKGNCAGNSVLTCEHKSISKKYHIGTANSDTSYLEFFYQASVGNENILSWTYMIVSLINENDQEIIFKRYYLPQGLGSGANLEEYILLEPGSEQGLWKIDLSTMGENLNFSKISITLISYACEGTNAFVFDHLVFYNDVCSKTDTDLDGVVDEWDECPDTPPNSYVNSKGCPSPGLYTEEQVNKMVADILAWGDMNGDNKIGLTEAIHALRTTVGLPDSTIKK